MTDTKPEQFSINIQVDFVRGADGVWSIRVQGERDGFTTLLGVGQPLSTPETDLETFLDKNDEVIRSVLSDTVRDCATKQFHRTMYFPD